MTGLPTLQPGYRIGTCAIEDVAGAGGFGITYKAIDSKTSNRIAIKEYFPRSVCTRDPDGGLSVAHADQEEIFRKGLDRFVSEATTLARFDHPHIVKIFQIWGEKGTAYFAMEYINGPSLEQWATSATDLPTQEQLDCFATALLEALETIHLNEFLHRDLAPKNILLRDDGLPVLIDFGSAREVIGSKAMTAMVTPNYAPIEQHLTHGQGQGSWTDIYGASATIYRVLTGVPPADANTRALDESVHLPVSEILAGQYRTSFLDALDWGLQVHPKDRPQSINEWRRSLLDGQTQSGSSGFDTSVRLGRRSRKTVVERIRSALGGRSSPR